MEKTFELQGFKNVKIIYNAFQVDEMLKSKKSKRSNVFKKNSLSLTDIFILAHITMQRVKCLL